MVYRERRSTRNRGTTLASEVSKNNSHESSEDDVPTVPNPRKRRGDRNSNSGTVTNSAPNKKTKKSSKEDTSTTPTKKAKGPSLSKEDKVKEMDARILQLMLTFHEEEKPTVRVEDVAMELGVHIRTRGFRDRWGFLKNTRKLIGMDKSGKGHILTKAGLDEAATPEYKERMKELAIVPKTNSEHQERLKKHLKKPKSIIIFNFLLKFGSLSNAELSPLVGTNQRSHGFHYSLKELRVRGYVEVDPDHKGKGKNGMGKKFRLADKAFKAKEDRPKEEDIDTEELAKAVAKGLEKIESQKTSHKSSSKNIKKEETVKNKGSDVVQDKEVKLEDSDGADGEGVKLDDSDRGEDEESKPDDSDGVEDEEDEQEDDNGAEDEEVKPSDDDEDGIEKEEVKPNEDDIMETEGGDEPEDKSNNKVTIGAKNKDTEKSADKDNQKEKAEDPVATVAKNSPLATIICIGSDSDSSSDGDGDGDSSSDGDGGAGGGIVEMVSNKEGKSLNTNQKTQGEENVIGMVEGKFEFYK